MADFWNAHSLQPKRKFRYVVEFPQGDGDTFTIAAKTIAKPEFDVGSTAHKFLNHTFFFPNRLEWKPITVTLVDHLGGGVDYTREESITHQLYQMVVDSGYTLPNTFEACQAAITKHGAHAAVGQVRIVQLGDGDVHLDAAHPGQSTDRIEEWTLWNCWIQDIKFGDLDYGSEDIVEVSLTLVYDFATLAGVNG
jgi:hypothetical protein